MSNYYKIKRQDGLNHAVDSPAVVTQDGTKIWYQYGVKHRLDGPAVEHPDGTKEWWVICKNAKVGDFKIHDLRHSSVSWYFVNTNLTDIEISKISGHIELSTLKRYATLRHSDIGAKLWARTG